MTDLLTILPDFAGAPFASIFPSLERAGIRVADLLTLEPVDVAKQAQLPAAQVRRLADALRDALLQPAPNPDPSRVTPASLQSVHSRWHQISCLDDGLDAALAGGVPSGLLTEFTGERCGSGSLDII